MMCRAIFVQRSDHPLICMPIVCKNSSLWMLNRKSKETLLIGSGKYFFLTSSHSHGCIDATLKRKKNVY